MEIPDSLSLGQVNCRLREGRGSNRKFWKNVATFHTGGSYGPMTCFVRDSLMLNDWWSEVRYGIRMLAKSPGFTGAAVLTLALGIAVNSTVFSYVNALLLRPPADVLAPGRLCEVWFQNKKA